MTRKEKAAEIAARLERLYPVSECALRYEGEPWRLLVMAILSAQCTDARVNIVAPPLFLRFPGPAETAEANIAELEELIKSCGLYHSKAANIKASAARLIDCFGGEVPASIEELLTLPGVGRKIANLILGDIFGLPGIVANTHCIRISSRLGFTAPGETSPERTERALSAIVEPSAQSAFCHRLVFFGREFCSAKKPLCGSCPLSELCRYRAEKNT